MANCIDCSFFHSGCRSCALDHTKHAIGYAEADALPFFPAVAAIPISVHGVGYEPTRINTLHGDYSFYATEYLCANGIPHGLEADIINFLMSKAVAAQLRDTSFISCLDLSQVEPEQRVPGKLAARGVTWVRHMI